MIYSILSNPDGDTYINLIRHCVTECDSFIFVTRDPGLLKYRSKTIDMFADYLLKQEITSNWPGTVLIGGKATVHTHTLNEKTAELLITVASSLYDWQEPNLPEDLCFLKKSSPWLVTTSHEKDGYFDLTENEKDNLQKNVPNLVIEKDQ